jgi:dephospho-CoA kinase
MEQRDLGYADAVLRIDAQPSQEEKIARADVIIDNGGSIAATVCQVEKAWVQIESTDPARASAIQ